jgi:hypothetical protein
MPLESDKDYSFRFFAECRDWPTHLRMGNDAQTIRRNIVEQLHSRAGINVLGGETQPRIDVVENWFTHDVLSGTMVVHTTRSVERDFLDQLILGACNIGAFAAHMDGDDLFVRHIPGIAALYTASGNAPSGSVFGSGAMVVQEQSVMMGTMMQAPQSSASNIGRITSSANDVTSTDPMANHMTPSANWFDGLFAGAGNFFNSTPVKATLIVGGVVIGSLLLLVGIGYAASSVANATRALKGGRR